MNSKPDGGNMAARLLEVRRTGAELSEATKDLNNKLSAIEMELANLQTGVSAGVLMSPATPGLQEVSLNFTKHGNLWGLFVEAPGEKPIPLKHASREMRLLAADSLGALVEEIMKRSSAELELVRGKVAKVSHLLDQFSDIPF